MKLWLTLVLSLFATLAQAQGNAPRPAAPAADSRAVGAPEARQAPKSFTAAETPRNQAATVALSYTDDAEAILLPNYATRNMPPLRLLRVGVQWSF